MIATAAIKLRRLSRAFGRAASRRLNSDMLNTPQYATNYFCALVLSQQRARPRKAAAHRAADLCWQRDKCGTELG
jgi:hypothetical protein